MSQSTSSKLNIADWISLYRVFVSPALVLLMLLDLKLIFGISLFISFFSDTLDGYIARRLDIVTERGARLDSIGDAITLVVGVVGIVYFESAFIMDNIIAVAIVLALYVIQILIAVIRYGKPSSFHTYLAKIAAFAVGFFMLGVFVFGAIPWLFYLAVVLGILETIEEIILSFVLRNWHTNVKGLYWVLKDKDRFFD